MAYINRVTIMGDIAYQPELRQTSNGKPVCSLSVVTIEKRKDNEFKTFHKCSVWGAMAERCASLHAGDRVVLEGSLKTDSWEDKDTKKKVYQTKIDTFNVGFLKGESVEPERQLTQAPSEITTPDDIPF